MDALSNLVHIAEEIVLTHILITKTTITIQYMSMIQISFRVPALKSHIVEESFSIFFLNIM